MVEHLIELTSDVEAGVVGGKASGLARLGASGFPVPDAVAVPAGLSDDMIEAAACEVVERFATAELAVRSSAVGEDGATTSFAGAFLSVLDVAPEAAAVADAIRRVRASALGAAGLQEAPPMGVVVMPMVAADASGIAFTRHPVSGADIIVLEAVEGIANRLASGEADGERWEVGAGVAVPEGATVLSAEDAQRIAVVARRIEEAEGCPQDVEWVLADGELVVVQTRPITTAEITPLAIEEEVPPGPWDWDSTHSQYPNTPYLGSFFPESFRRGSTQLAEEYGLPIDHLAMRRIGGYFHVQVVPPVGSADAKPPPAPLLRLLFKVVPVLRRRAAAAKRTLADRTDREWARRWADERRPRFEQLLGEWSGLDLSALDDEELAEIIDLMVSEAQECFGWNMLTDMSYLLPLAVLIEFAERHLGLGVADVLPLLAGEESSEYARSIAHAAALLGEDERRALADGRAEEVVNEGFWQAYREHCAMNDCRGLGYDLDVPCHGEIGVDELASIARWSAPADPAAGARAKAVEMRATLAEDLRPEFDLVLGEARTSYPIREESEYVHSRIMGGLRFALLEAGRRMVGVGSLADAGHVVLLEQPEVRQWLLGRSPIEETVLRRRREQLWAMHNPPRPDGNTAAAPDEASFPPAVRQVLQAILLVQAHDQRPHETDGVSDGVGASPGRHTGPARRVVGPHEFDRIEDGDVVIAPLTTSAWEVVFDRMGALVTEGGGLLSHPAIVAREHGMPAVTGFVGAMDRFVDGQVVTVDGSAGTVTAHQS